MIKIINMETFPWHICFSIGNTEKEVCDFLKNKMDYELDEEERNHVCWDKTSKRGTTIMLKNNAVILWVKTYDQSIVAHEAFHAATFILERAGLKFSQDSEEAWAYVIEKIVRNSLIVKRKTK